MILARKCVRPWEAVEGPERGMAAVDGIKVAEIGKGAAKAAG
jgi:hypothetical protein